MHVADGKGIARRHEKEIEQRHRQHRRQRRRPAPVPHRHGHHGRQEQHDDVGEVEHRPHQARQHRCRTHVHAGGKVSGPQPGAVRFGSDALGGIAHIGAADGRSARRQLHARRIGGGADHIHLRAMPRQRLGEIAARQATLQPDRQAQRHDDGPRRAPAPGRRATDHGLGDVVATDIAGDGLHRVGAGQRLDLGAGVLGHLEQRVQPLGTRIDGAQVRHHHGHRVPVAFELRGQARGAADHLLAVALRVEAGDQGLARAPDVLDAARAAIGLHVVVDAVGGAAQRQFAQRDQVALAEEVARRVLGLLGHVDLALGQAAQQFIGGQIDQDHLGRAVEDRVGHRLPHADAGDAADGLVQAVEVLHVDRGPHIDPDGEQVFDVLPTLRMTRTGHVGMRKLIDEDQRGLARQRGIQVELGQGAAAVLDPARRQGLQALHQRGGLGTAVGLDQPDHHIDPLGPRGLGGREHRVSLADARRCAEIDAQLAAGGLLLAGVEFGEEGVGVGAGFVHGGYFGCFLGAWWSCLTLVVHPLFRPLPGPPHFLCLAKAGEQKRRAQCGGRGAKLALLEQRPSAFCLPTKIQDAA